ncbi:MAG: GWxTD domain-containing protein [Candidatus Saccharicenans sp.]|jgi:GWxTD domain-containing protein|nr:GWxTD domain-containing protein [Candidatus Saccharicenans sp.]MDH7494213.1 GWxTD domain-containing protein [Candidatus Saccharicenans sp.]
MKKTIPFLLVLVFVFSAACGVGLLPSKDSWYAKHYFIMHDFERETYKKLTDQGRLHFQTLFWEARQPVAKENFDTRIAYIERVYKTENRSQPWNTDRARVYLLNGPPASIDYRQNTDWVTNTVNQPGRSGTQQISDRSTEDIQANTAEIWVYPYDKYFVYYIFTFSPPNSWKLNPSTYQNNQYLQDLENLNKDLTFGIVDKEAYKAKLDALPRK